MHLLTIGETLGVAATPRGEQLATATTLRLGTAGAEATVAIGVARLGHRASMVGRIGDDGIGERVRRDLRGEGVGVEHLAVTPGSRTGFMLRDRKTTGHTVVEYHRTGSAGSQLSPDDVDAAVDALPTIDVLHLTGITAGLGEAPSAAVDRAIERARAHGATVSFDVNHRRGLALSATLPERLAGLVRRADVVFVGDDELSAIGLGDDPIAFRELLGAGVSELVVKRGAEGAEALLASGERAEASARRVVVEDVIGAGDSFVAGYLVARAEHRPVEERLRWGVAAAARTVAAVGDWEGLPRRDELLRDGELVTGAAGVVR